MDAFAPPSSAALMTITKTKGYYCHYLNFERHRMRWQDLFVIYPNSFCMYGIIQYRLYHFFKTCDNQIVHITCLPLVNQIDSLYLRLWLGLHKLNARLSPSTLPSFILQTSGNSGWNGRGDGSRTSSKNGGAKTRSENHASWRRRNHLGHWRNRHSMGSEGERVHPGKN